MKGLIRGRNSNRALFTKILAKIKGHWQRFEQQDKDPKKRVIQTSLAIGIGKLPVFTRVPIRN